MTSRNTSYWKTWEVNTICKWNLASFCQITKEKNPSNFFYKNCNLKTSPRPFCVCKELDITSIGKLFFKQAIYIRYVIAKLSKFVQISLLPPQIPFYRGSFENWKGSGTSFQATFFTEFFDKFFSFVILHKLTKFHYQTVFTFQLIQWNVFLVLFLVLLFLF